MKHLVNCNTCGMLSDMSGPDFFGSLASCVGIARNRPACVLSFAVSRVAYGHQSPLDGGGESSKIPRFVWVPGFVNQHFKCVSIRDHAAGALY